MSIKGLTDRGMAFPEIGQVRKGEPKHADGTIGRDLNYFRVEFSDAEEEARQKFIDTYGSQPNELNILLPFNEIERCWDAFLEAYTAGRMVARSDGEKFIYWVDTATGEIKVKNGDPITVYTDGQKVGSYTDKNGREIPITCKPVGRLKLVIPELQRMAYVTLITSSVHDIQNLSSQIQALWTVNNGQIAGIPMKLRRRPKEISVPKKDGTRMRLTKWMLSIEADPAWVKAKLLEVKKLALPGNGLALLPEPEIAHSEPVEDTSQVEGDIYDEDDELDIPSEPVMEVEQPATAMDLKLAESQTGKDNKPYGNCTDEELQGKLIGCRKAIAEKPNMSPKDRETYQFKIDAILTILNHRQSLANQLPLGGVVS